MNQELHRAMVILVIVSAIVSIYANYLTIKKFNSENQTAWVRKNHFQQN